jgi:hypothetical protein
MKLPIASILLALLPLAGIVYIVLTGDLFTVDGLFMSIMLLTISGVFGLDAALDLYSARKSSGDGGLVAAAAGYPGAKVETGSIRDLRFFEAYVGEQNKTLVEFIPDGAKASRFLSFIGNVRDQLPVGSRVRMIYRTDPEGNVLIDRENLYMSGRTA